MVIDVIAMLARKFGNRGARRVAIGLRPVVPARKMLHTEMRVQNFESGMTQQAFATVDAEGLELGPVSGSRQSLIGASQRREFFRTGFRPVDESSRAVVLRRLAAQ